MKEFLRRHSLVIGILLMFLLTWPIDLSNAGVLNFKVPFAVYIFLGWGFIVAALIMTALTLGWADVVKMLKGYLIWRVDWKWYLAAFFLIPGLNFLAIAIHATLSGSPIDFSRSWPASSCPRRLFSCWSYLSLSSTSLPMERKWAGGGMYCRACRQNTAH